MSERSTYESFIVRIYRVDTEDHRKINGLVEALDGSGERERFTDTDELGIILNRRARRPEKRRAKGAKFPQTEPLFSPKR